MSDIKLYQIINNTANELKGVISNLEKPLQTLIENNLETLLGIRFIKTEHLTGKTHGGRIDTLGLDENSCPVIIEYKRHKDENVINQGLFYLDWLMDHQAEFFLLVEKKLGRENAKTIDWLSPRLVCIAADFTKFDGHAVQQINRNIELIRYRQFGQDLLLFELANAVSASTTVAPKKPAKVAAKGAADKPVADWLAELTGDTKLLFDALENYLFSLGDDVQRKDLKFYLAYKRLRNFVCVVIATGRFLLFVKLDPDTVTLDKTFMRDVRKIGHWATGDLEITIKTMADLERIKPLLLRAYEGE